MWTLPAVVQWQEYLVAIHALPRIEDWLGPPPAYFPTFAFDEVAFVDTMGVRQDKGDGYVALTASQDPRTHPNRPDRLPELRAHHREQPSSGSASGFR
jgi:hypothetical protein